MQIDWWTLALQAINVLVLIWLLQRFLFRPVADIIEERRKATDRSLSEAESERDQARAEHARAREEAEAQMASRAAALKAAESEAGQRRDKLVAAARDEAAKISAAAREEVARARNAASAEAADRGALLAADIAAKLFRRLPPEAQVLGFIDAFAEALATQPEEIRASIAPENKPIRLKAPRALQPEEEAACRAALSRALGRPIELAVEPDPGVIAGLEAEGPLGVVRNSFRADLEKLTVALTHDDPAFT